MLICGFMALPLALVISLTVSPEREDALTLLDRVIDAQERQQKLAREYAFRETTVTRDLDAAGKVRKTKSEAFLVTPGPDGEYRRLLARDGKPLSPQEEAKEERKFQEYLREQLGRRPEELERETRKKLESRVRRFQERLREAREVFDFETLEDDVLQGEPVRVFRFFAKPGYQPHSRATDVLSRMEGRVWVDPKRDQIARLEVRFVKSLKFLGGVFGRVSEGSEAAAEAWFDGEGVWLLDEIALSLNARLYFLKTYRQQIAIDYHDYQRYRVSTAEQLKTPSSK
jgi:hypothetical protein